MLPDRFGPAVPLDWPIATAARTILKSSLKVVHRLYQQTARDDNATAENVHRLRVAIRRTLAAMRFFKRTLPHRRRRKLKDQLRRIRRIAGDVRDLDVVLHWINGTDLPHDSSAGRQELLDVIARCRKQRQRAIYSLGMKNRPRHLRGQSRKLLKGIDRSQRRSQSAEATFAGEAQHCLTPLTESFSRALLADFSDVDSLHALRLQAKRLRYSLDTFAAAFPAEQIDAVIRQMRELQDDLGGVNDRAVAERILQHYSPKCRSSVSAPVVDFLLARNTTQLKEAQCRFRENWTADRVRRLQSALSDLLPKVDDVTSSMNLPHSA